jgi:hypothetical protein
MTRAAHRIGPGVRGAGIALVAAAALLVVAPAYAADTYTVTGTSDSPSGSCSGAFVCTNLRAAVTAANADPGSTIELGSGQYQLSDGELAITANMTIDGQGPSHTTIQQTDGTDRVIHVTTASAVAITGVTITGGTVVGAAGGSPGANGQLVTEGGGIASDSFGSLTLTDDAVVNNSVTGGAGAGNSGAGNGGAGGYALGGGIYNKGALTITDTTIAGNMSTSGAGGNTTGTGNGGPSSGAGGGGIFEVGALTVRDSTISGNTAAVGAPGTSSGGGATGSAGTAFGAGIDDQQAAGSVLNSTIANNVATTPGGPVTVAGLGTASSGTPLTLASDTFAGNNASGGAGENDANLYIFMSSPTIAGTLLVAGSGGANCDISGTTITDRGHNLEDDAGASCGLSGANGDLVGADPLLGSLASNGGPTETMALGAHSPAIHAGGQCPDPTNGGAALQTDQRGEPRHNPCDIGAFESQPPALLTAPTISGSAEVGGTLRCSEGTFSGDQPLSYSYRWLRDGSSLSGATSSSYEVASGDMGHQLACGVTASNPYGNASGTSAAVAVAVVTEPAPPPPAPILTGLKQSHKRWREGIRLASFARVHRPAVGTTFSFALNEQARVSLTFTQPHAGRKVKGRCVAETKRNRQKSACTLSAGALTFTCHAGTNKIFFAGRLTRHKRLKPGRYALVIVATNSAGQRSTPRKLRFAIV